MSPKNRNSSVGIMKIKFDIPKKFNIDEIKEIAYELKSYHNYKIKNANKCSCFKCYEQKKIIDNLIKKLKEKSQ